MTQEEVEAKLAELEGKVDKLLEAHNQTVGIVNQQTNALKNMTWCIGELAKQMGIGVSPKPDTNPLIVLPPGGGKVG